MLSVTIETASMRLSELIMESPAGEEIILTQNSLPVAKLVRLSRKPRKAGSAKNIEHFMADDFKKIPDGFEDYLP